MHHVRAIRSPTIIPSNVQVGAGRLVQSRRVLISGEEEEEEREEEEKGTNKSQLLVRVLVPCSGCRRSLGNPRPLTGGRREFRARVRQRPCGELGWDQGWVPRICPRNTLTTVRGPPGTPPGCIDYWRPRLPKTGCFPPIMRSLSSGKLFARPFHCVGFAGAPAPLGRAYATLAKGKGRRGGGRGRGRHECICGR
ncbi:uncharacterized protein LY79DRAFT_276801 [Colletotrichum navitas]|uniref:Uncharacterized protein n=1 Tax=Colletotrichum navitas TaxID=681940 RepID=A0AAD8PVX8_9PEZI|nr:uncharacterized protein LY79DRAFT_276801 [Colletotrichum navitas]KAK1585181.1 hypothetical protein LY79DRAFT_276801 [Colletotrichum navitas]